MEDRTIKNQKEARIVKNKRNYKRTYEFDLKYWIDSGDKWGHKVLENERFRSDLVQAIFVF